MTKAKVVVVGSMSTDYVTRTPVFPRAGETVFGRSQKIGQGGKGANQCVAAARLGAATAMVGKLGTDAAGDDYMNAFAKTTIDTTCISRTNQHQTAAANVMVDDSGQNCIICIPGANHALTTQDVEATKEVIGGAAVVLCQNESTMAATRTALQIARQAGVKTLMNAAPFLPDLDPEIIRLSDYFCVNESEAEGITGVAVRSVEDAVAAGKTLTKERGCRSAIVTLGAGGVVMVEGEQVLHVPAKTAVAKDTTGAGDAFIGAFAYFLAYHPSMSMTLKLARSCYVAAMSVEKEGTWDSFPSRDVLPRDLFIED